MVDVRIEYWFVIYFILFQYVLVPLILFLEKLIQETYLSDD